MDVVASIMESLRKLRHRVDATVARVVIERVNDALKTQRVTISILAGETSPDVEHFQPYGLSFTPPVGSEAIGLAVAGARSHTLAICAQHPGERPTDSPARTGGLYSNGQWRLFVDAAGVVCVGAEDSAQHLPLGDVLKQLLEQLTVPTAMGPSGTPVNAAQFAQFLSTHKVAP